MYAKHNKNINRNKSFHPLTYNNLRKTEEIQEKQASDAKAQEERLKTLRTDQERRRYDDLVRSASSTGMGLGFGSATAGGSGAGRMVVDIFADDEVESTAASPPPPQQMLDKPQASSSSSAVAAPRGTSFLAKFTKEEPRGVAAESVEATGAGHKRARGDDPTTAKNTDGHRGDHSAGVTAPTTTGFITTSEVARLRAEHELVKKQQLDPLLKVQRHQDRTVAEVARAREKKAKLEEEERAVASGQERPAEKSTKQAIQDILKELQARSRAQK